MSQMLTSWLGSGGVPVDQNTSTYRAITCAMCRFNKKPSPIERIFKNPAAKALKKYLDFKWTMKIGTVYDKQLFMCAKCGCATALKVHVPKEHIRAYTTDEQLKGLPENCWIKKEIYA